nr:hypothetical protein [Tanacetum cinerariifolium]
LSTLHFLKFPENSFEVLKLLENSVEVLKISENKLVLMKIPENKLESLKLQENRPVYGLVPLSIKKITSECVLPLLLKNAYTFPLLLQVPLSFQASACSLSTLHFLKFPENSFEVLKLLENSVEVLKISENKLVLMKIPENKLESLKLQENRPNYISGSTKDTQKLHMAPSTP